MAVERAREAVARGDRERAYALLVEADAAGSLGPEGLGLLAEVAYVTGRLEATFEAWERVHARAAEAGDSVTAAEAAARVAMHLLMDTGLLAPVRVWAARAEALLDGQPQAPVHAVLAVARGYERLLSGDFAAATRHARHAVEVGNAQGVAAPAALGRMTEARGVMFDGDVEQGLALLDASAALAISDKMDPLSVGLVYCELVCAWQGLAQHDRAEELTEAMQRWCQRHDALGSVHGRCRVHRAEMLRLRGDLDAAEHEARRACEELQPYLRREFGWPLTELGVIRLQRGDFDGAGQAFVQAHEGGWDPQPGLALLRLEQGDLDTAVTMIGAALEQPRGTPSKELPPNTELRRAPLLAAQVEICAAAGHLEQAQVAADELARVAETFASRTLQAAAARGRGTVDLAAGDLDAARHRLARAVDAYHELAMPYDSAHARLKLAHTYQQQGERALAQLEFDAAASAFERLGAPAPTPPWSAGDGPAGQRTAQDARVGLRVSTGRFHAEGEYWSISFSGETVRLRDLKGLRYLARLLAEPGREFHALDVAHAANAGHAAELGSAAPGEVPAYDGGDAGPALDDQAKAAYRRRLDEIDEDIDEARRRGDDERAARATVERDFLVNELARAVGLGGRDRPVGAAAERARVSVTRAVRYALARIHAHHPELGAHLEHAVRTGTYLSYQPDPQAPTSWEL